MRRRGSHRFLSRGGAGRCRSRDHQRRLGLVAAGQHAGSSRSGARFSDGSLHRHADFAGRTLFNIHCRWACWLPRYCSLPFIADGLSLFVWTLVCAWRKSVAQRRSLPRTHNAHYVRVTSPRCPAYRQQATDVARGGIFAVRRRAACRAALARSSAYSATSRTAF